ncbi:S8 family peptidase [Streptomyces cadmiisoli]|uniref:S8 family peptidase n=1 Tax=Streptomyces cadmiisoli TaxID=2184053 RepID=UPI003D724B38
MALGVTALMLPLSTTTSAGAQPAPPVGSKASANAFGPAAAAAARSGPRTVTLITGDKAVVTPAAGGAGTVSVSGPHGEPIAAKTHRVGNDIYVYPESAAPYVSAGLLDKELFNVTQLVADGYDDARVNQLPLIVTYASAADARKQGALRGSTRIRSFSSINGAAIAEDRGRATEFWSAITSGVKASALAPRDTLRASPASKSTLAGGISKIWLDGKVEATLADSTAQIGAPAAWAGGNTGKGVKVAVLDSGVDDGHPDLVGQVAEAINFVQDLEPGPGDPQRQATDETDAVDRQGHGTHVASTIAGTGAASGGKEKGVAPGARLHVGKVLNDQGQGNLSWILAGMEWAARDAGAKIISMSLGGGPSDGSDPLSQAVDQLSAETGALFTIAAGNSGSTAKTVATPGAASAALTVGAVDGDDKLADFSSRGPLWGNSVVKPEITAPGVDVLAALSRHAGGAGDYMKMSGNSMATPHVAGAAALLAAEHPDWTGQQLKDALVSTSKPTPDYTAFQAGAGRVDAAAATKATLFATGTVSLGEHAWPAEPGAIVSETVTYTNTGDAPVVLDLAVSSSKAPAGLFTLSKDKVSVPAHGTSTVTVTANVDKAAAGKNYEARIDASAGGTRLAHTAVGFVTANQTFKVTVVPKDRSGEIYKGDAALVGVSDQESHPYLSDWTIDLESWFNPGVFTLELPAGTWSLAYWMQVQGDHGSQSRGRALLAAPQIELDRDMTVEFDATKARQMKLVTPRESETTALRVDYTRAFPGGNKQNWSFLTGRTENSIWTVPTTKVTDGTLEVRTRWRNEQPAMKLSAGGETYRDLLVRRGTKPLSKGTHRMAAVHVGQGAEADYEGRDVRGKAVIVDRNDTVPLSSQAATAAAAGAGLLLVVNDGPGRVEPLAFDSIAPLTIATLKYDEGRRLISRVTKAGKSLEVYSNPTTEYLYDVVGKYHDKIPTDLVQRPRIGDLARVDMSFRNYRPAQATDFRYDVWPENDWWAVGWPELPGQGQGDRTDYVSPDVKYRESAMVIGETRVIAADKHYGEGSRTAQNWFSPIQRPRVSYDSSMLGRFSTFMTAFVGAGWGDAGADREGYTNHPGVQASTSVYQGDTLLEQAPTYWATVRGLKPERLPYRIVSEQSRGTWASPYSTSTRTVWDFTSGAGAPNDMEPLPLVQLDYDVDTDFSGKAHRGAELTVKPAMPGQWPTAYADLPPVAFQGVTLQLSYDDGATWHRTSLKRTSDGRGWRAELNAPKGAKFVTLKAGARDAEGNAVEQTITRAFGLK